VVADVSLAVAPGEIFGIVGADGAGKSSLLRLLTGQWRATAGSVRVLGMRPDDERLRERIAYLPQSFGQYLDLTVQENLEFYAALHGRRGMPEVLQWLSWFDPLRWHRVVIRDVFLKGGGLLSHPFEYAMMALLGGAALALSLWRLRI